MFRHQGSERSDRLNRLLAGYLAFVAGYVNSCGFVLIASFTSHVTGNVGRFANDLVEGQAQAAAGAATLIFAFFVGAFFASMVIESNLLGSTPRSYGAALSVEAALLVGFTVVTSVTTTSHARIKDVEAILLCAAMGLQNSLVTRLSGAVVRTTHLTGVVTDIAIEAALWFRWWRGSLSRALRVKLAFGKHPPARPSLPKMALLITIAGAFSAGAVVGASAADAWPRGAMGFPCLAVGGAAIYAFLSAFSRADVRALPPD